MKKTELNQLKINEEIFQIPTEEDIKRKELISVLAELILNYFLSKKE